ncbi:organic cation transporter protein-like isoform X1 [Clavelina lepadiformis]|uniref:organic cation transporter protein-like isoform X1 n=1 Tax=Clavelina lepadiformis TaxID=159417 RepID=UPI004041B0C9
MKYEDLMSHVGKFGIFQKLIAAAMCLNYFAIGLVLMYNVFILYTPPHQCKLGLTENLTTSNATEIPRNEIYESNGTATENPLRSGECYSYGVSGAYNYTQQACTSGWTYDTVEGVTSITTEFDLVCTQAWIKPFIQSIQLGGVMAGSILGGILSDKYGRRRTLLFHGALLIASIFLLGNMPSIEAIEVFSFILGFASSTTTATSVVILHENIPPKSIAFFGFLQMSFSSLGYAFMSLFDFLVPNWRHLMTGTGIITSVVLLPSLFVPETVRWSLENENEKETLKLLETIAKVNCVNTEEKSVKLTLRQADDRKITPDCESAQPLQIKTKIKEGTLDLFKLPFLRRRFIILGISWFSVGLVYFAFGFNTDNLGVSRHLGACLAALMDIPSNIIGFLLVRTIGKRKAFITLSSMAGVFFLLTPGLRKVNVWVGMVSAMLGKLFASGIISLMIVTTPDFFPTSLRNQAFGACFSIGRLGGMLSPFVIYLGENVFEIFPFILMSVMVCAAAVCVFFLPETTGRPLPNTMHEAELLEKYRVRVSCCKKDKRNLYDDDGGELRVMQIEETLS